MTDELTEEEKKKQEEKDAELKAIADKEQRKTALIEEYKKRFSDWMSEENFDAFAKLKGHEAGSIKSPEDYESIIAEYKTYLVEVVGQSDDYGSGKTAEQETDDAIKANIKKLDTEKEKFDEEFAKTQKEVVDYQETGKGTAVHEGTEDKTVNNEDITTNEQGERQREDWEKAIIEKLKAFAAKKYPNDKDNNFSIDDSKAGLYIGIKDTVFHYANENKVTFGKKDGSIPDMDEFREMVGTANGAIGFGNIKDDEYKARLMIACMESGTTMEGAPKFEDLKNLSEETKKAYQELMQRGSENTNDNDNNNKVEKQLDAVKNRLLAREVLTGDRFEQEESVGAPPLLSAQSKEEKQVDKNIDGQSPLASTAGKPSSNEVFQQWVKNGLKEK